MCNTLFAKVPDKLRQVSTCPKCGAPIYVDADLGQEVIDTLPVPWFTCWCRMQQYNAPSSITLSVPNSVPGTPAQPTWTPFPSTTICSANGNGCATATSPNVPLG